MFKGEITEVETGVLDGHGLVRSRSGGKALRFGARFLIAGLFVLSVSFFGTTFGAVARPAPTSFADLVETLSPAVVNISTEQTISQPEAGTQTTPPTGTPFDDFFRDFFDNQRSETPRRSATLGSGYIVSEDGIVVTNDHVVGKADVITVTLADGNNYEAKLIGRDPKTDIAILKIQAKRKFPFVAFGDSEKLRVGDWVIAIGNPFGFGGTVTAGIVSGRNRQMQDGSPYADYIQTDAPINRGNSGGPLFDIAGSVIGMNTAIYSNSGGSIGIGFAIPSDVVAEVVDQLIDNGEVQRGWLGVRVQFVSDEIGDSLGLKSPTGALITLVTPDSPADKAGVKTGDLILKFDGQIVSEMRDLPRIVGKTKVGKKVNIQVLRQSKKKNLRVIVEKLNDAPQLVASSAPDQSIDKQSISGLGVRVTNLTQTLRDQFQIENNINGVVVVAVDPNGPAYGRMVPGDVIVEVDQREVPTLHSFQESVAENPSSDQDKPFLLLVNRDGNPTFVTVQKESS